jgi:hypothetical protein
VYYDDGDTSQWVDTSPQGSGVSDAISEGNTSAEVIDTGSDGRFVVTTEGSERLRITSAGRVGIGTNSPQDTLTVDTSIGVYRASSDPTLSFSVGGTVSAPTKSYRLLIDDSDSDKFQLRDGVTPRVTVDGSGNVGIGTTSPPPGALLAVNGQPWVLNQNALLFMNADNTLGCYINGSGAGGVNPDMVFSTSYNERARIDSSGRLGIGTSSPSTPLEVAGAVGSGVISDYLSLYYPQSYGGGGSGPRMLFKANDIAGTKSTYAGIWSLLHANTVGAHSGKLVFGTTSGGNLVERLRIDESGNVGIGTATVDELLHLKGASAASTTLKVESTATASERSSIHFFNGSISRGRIGGSNDFDGLTLDSSTTESAAAIRFRTGGASLTERARLDASGRLLVGTSTGDSNTRLHVSASENTSDPMATDASITIANTVNAGNNEAAALKFNLGNTNTASISAHYDAFSAGVNSSLRFYTQFQSGFNSPTERMRIGQNGSVAVRSTGNYPFVSNSSSAPGTTATLFAGNCNATDLVGTGATTVFIVYNNGNVQNTNNSYAGISDIKLKENIVDATSQWDDLKALQVRNYNFKEGQTHTQIGLIAQEVELVSPGLVTESPDRDEDGNDLGTVTKSVNYSVLYMKAVKALQEAMTRIETLEATNASLEARLTALEGGTN